MQERSQLSRTIEIEAHSITSNLARLNTSNAAPQRLQKHRLFLSPHKAQKRAISTILHNLLPIPTLPPCYNDNKKTTIVPNVKWISDSLPCSVPQLDVQYLHYHATINSSIELTPAPLLELAASIGSKELSLGGEVGFNTASASFTKCNAGIDLNKQDFSASLILGDKGETLKASYIHMVDPINSTAVAAEMTHRFTTYENSFTIGGSQVLDPLTLVKARLSHNGKVAMVCQREWRPKSLVTLSAEFDPKAVNGPPRFGFALALKP